MKTQVAAVVQRSGGIDLHYSKQTLLQGHSPPSPFPFQVSLGMICRLVQITCSHLIPDYICMLVLFKWLHIYMYVQTQKLDGEE